MKTTAQDNHLICSIILCTAVIFMLAQSIAFADAEITERIEWKKIPIKLNLKVGHERLIHFPSPVKVGLPSSSMRQLGFCRIFQASLVPR